MSQTLVATTTDDLPREAGMEFDQLYRSSRDDVYAYAAGLLRDQAAAEDVTATAFERAYRKRSRFDPGRGSARAWLFGIARNAALDELRRRGKQASLAAEQVDVESLAQTHPVEGSERRIVLADALRDLEPRERELVALKFFAGLSNVEIARVLGISESNAGTRIHRVIDKLREACHEVA
ncbi:MAG TPA: sigma-70 family RNA polymerase sigma factor [Solirubrobacterales bacterium]|nr:sigma-70 family RNA polymerase sigma factor [Solirubrobacterales bacterium]